MYVDSSDQARSISGLEDCKTQTQNRPGATWVSQEEEEIDFLKDTKETVNPRKLKQISSESTMKQLQSSFDFGVNLDLGDNVQPSPQEDEKLAQIFSISEIEDKSPHHFCPTCHQVWPESKKLEEAPSSKSYTSQLQQTTITQHNDFRLPSDYEQIQDEYVFSNNRRAQKVHLKETENQIMLAKKYLRERQAEMEERIFNVEDEPRIVN